MKNKLLLLAMGFALTTQMIIAQAPSYVPSDGLVGYWGFNGNADDQSGNGNNGTVNGATLTTDRFGNANTAYSFDGVNDFISVPANINFTQNPISYSFWFNKAGSGNPCNGNETFQAIFSTGNYSQSRDVVLGQGPAKRIGIQRSIPTGCQNESMLSTNYTFNTWNHAVVTYEANLVKVYLNGIFIGSSPVSCSVTATNTTCFIGASNASIWACIAYFNGLIDDIGIWNRALTQEEITAMYNGVEYSETCNAVSGSLVDGLVAYYPFCGNAKDASGNSNNGTVNGATLTTDRFGNTNTAYSFNGTDNYISTNPLTLKSFSLSAWIYNTSVNPLNLNGIISNLNAIPYEGIEFRVDDDSTLQLVCGLATDWSHSTTTFKLQDNTWYNIIATSDNSTVKIYVNSQQIASYSISNFTNNTSNLLFGTRNPFASNGGWYTGKIDDIGIWNRALSQVEISNLYNSNICYQNITVNDTLVINTGILSYNPVTFNNTVTIYPNPANDKITIDCGNLDNVNGWSIKIFNTLGQEVFSGVMNTQKYVTPLNTWGGQGIYFVKIYDASNNLMNTKKIILN